MTLHWTPAVIDYLVQKGYSETYGARNLRRTIQRDVEDAIAMAIVAQRKAAGDIGIDAQDDHITVTIDGKGGQLHEPFRSHSGGDITKSDVDAIVNAANCSLLGGGGVGHPYGRQHRPQQQCRGLSGCHRRRRRSPAATVCRRATSSTRPAPAGATAQRSPAELLANCYRNSLRLASETTATRSISRPSARASTRFPAASGGADRRARDHALSCRPSRNHACAHGLL